MAQPVVADRSVKSLDVGILLRIAGLDITQRNPLPLCPALKLFIDVLRAVIAANGGRLAP